MNIFVLGNEVTRLFVATGAKLIISFNSQVNIIGGDSRLINIDPFGDGKHFSVSAKENKSFKTNVLFFNEKEKFNVVFENNLKGSHDFVHIKNASTDSVFSKIYSDKCVTLYKGTQTIMLEPTYKCEGVEVNESKLDKTLYKGLGAPLEINHTGKTVKFFMDGL